MTEVDPKPPPCGAHHQLGQFRRCQLGDQILQRGLTGHHILQGDGLLFFGVQQRRFLAVDGGFAGDGGGVHCQAGGSGFLPSFLRVGAEAGRVCAQRLQGAVRLQPVLQACGDHSLAQFQGGGNAGAAGMAAHTQIIDALFQQPDSLFLVVGGQGVQREGDGHRLALAGGQGAGLGKAGQHLVGLVQFALGLGQIHLHGLPARVPAAGVLHVHPDAHRLAVQRHILDLQREGGVQSSAA